MDQASRPDPLQRHLSHFAAPRGPSLIDRLGPHADWVEARIAAGTWPYARRLHTGADPVAGIAYAGQTAVNGVNLAVQDYLGLATHPHIKEAARRAIFEYGVHSAGSAMQAGNHPLSERLERAVAGLVRMPHVLLFPTGWGAGYGAVRGLVRDYDHIVLDEAVHTCLLEGAAAATGNIHRFGHLDSDHARRILADIRTGDRANGILLITEGLFSVDSEPADLRALRQACDAFGASLMVSVAHDLGCSGPGGTGEIGLQGLMGQADIVVGSFAKTFASNGGFVATADRRVKRYLQGFAGTHGYSNALSPVQCATVEKAIEIVASTAGAQRRDQLQARSRYFRKRLQADGLTVLGTPSAIVPVMLGDEAAARRASKALAASGTFAHLVEFPVVAVGAARFRCQLMSRHEETHLDKAVQDIAAAVAQAGGERTAGPGGAVRCAEGAAMSCTAL